MCRCRGQSFKGDQTQDIMRQWYSIWSGSDLDGDEYSVIWDPKLFFDCNEPAMIFPKGVSHAAKLDMSKLVSDWAFDWLQLVTFQRGEFINTHAYLG